MGIVRMYEYQYSRFLGGERKGDVSCDAPPLFRLFPLPRLTEVLAE